VLDIEGPLLIAANHPNSFLDAIVLATLFKNPIYSLARGDAFASKVITSFLQSFNMLPVYRVSEGVENLENNYDTFEACQGIFKQNGIVLIFSEGRCINEWHLRPLKKGTARLALEAWSRGIDLKVLPLGINYNAFRKIGKIVILNFGSFITAQSVEKNIAGRAISVFNEKLKAQLEKLVFQIDKNDSETLKKYFYKKPAFFKKITLIIPAIAGFVLHIPLYLVIHLSIKNRAKDHYDSVMTGISFFAYPFYIALITLLLVFLTHSSYSLLAVILMPFTLWSYIQLKEQV
jgi:1-acyl-sn-glycerol-3-phosphate acyltransferase